MRKTVIHTLMLLVRNKEQMSSAMYIVSKTMDGRFVSEKTEMKKELYV